jgi:outer membrane phospholipase A
MRRKSLFDKIFHFDESKTESIKKLNRRKPKVEFEEQAKMVKEIKKTKTEEESKSTNTSFSEDSEKEFFDEEKDRLTKKTDSIKTIGKLLLKNYKKKKFLVYFQNPEYKTQRTRLRNVNEIIETEVEYIDQLRLLFSLFLKPIKEQKLLNLEFDEVYNDCKYFSF